MLVQIVGNCLNIENCVKYTISVFISIMYFSGFKAIVHIFPIVYFQTFIIRFYKIYKTFIQIETFIQYDLT